MGKDDLTGLSDKYEFEAYTCEQLKKGVTRGALLLVDMDNFRYINDLYGWNFGDYVLKESTRRMEATLAKGLQLYRLDSDKFGTFFPNQGIGVVMEQYQAMLQALQRDKQFGEHRYYCAISGGCVAVQGWDKSFDTLYARATLALNQAKRSGKSRLDIYDAVGMEKGEREKAILVDLHESVDQENKGFEVYFQPQIEMGTLRVRSAEALLRWHGDRVGAISPSEFIPILEQSGLIHKVGQWVISQASAVCRGWRRHVPDFTVSVNLSFIQTQTPDFLPGLAAQIAAGDIDPAMLHLEITESCIADGSRQLKGVIDRLRSMGFVIEMDDFGTGYSSLEILKNAPADIVKLDQVFVKGITKNDFDFQFIKFTIAICHAAGIRVCLEGVECEEQYEMVRLLGLDFIQGFLFGRPEPEEEFTRRFILEKVVQR